MTRSALSISQFSFLDSKAPSLRLVFVKLIRGRLLVLFERAQTAPGPQIWFLGSASVLCPPRPSPRRVDPRLPTRVSCANRRAIVRATPGLGFELSAVSHTISEVAPRAMEPRVMAPAFALTSPAATHVSLLLAVLAAQCAFSCSCCATSSAPASTAASPAPDRSCGARPRRCAPGCGYSSRAPPACPLARRPSRPSAWTTPWRGSGGGSRALTHRQRDKVRSRRRPLARGRRNFLEFCLESRIETSNSA